MLKQFNKKDIDVIMKIWKDNNQKFQGFIDNQYWIDNYVKTRDELLNNEIYIYTESSKILAFIAIDPTGKITNIQVKPEIQREGIGEILIKKAKQDFPKIYVDIYERNINAILFFKAMGFRKQAESIDKDNKEKLYSMEWNENTTSDSVFIYFDNSISDEIIEKYDKTSKVQFYNIHTNTKSMNNMFNLNISNDIESKDGETYISDYIDVRNKLGSIIKNEKITIFYDCNNDYSYLDNVIKDIVKIRNTNITIIMHKPFSVEGGKKSKIYESVKKSYEDFNVVDVDYEALGQNQNITFADAFDRRDEELIKMICNSSK